MRNTVLGFALLLVVSLAVTASAGAVPSTGERQAVDTLKIGHVSITSLAEGSGYLLTGSPVILRKRNIVAKWSTFNTSSVNMTAALLAGSIDVAIIGVSTPINAVAQGGNLRVIAANTGYSGNLVLGRQTLSKLTGVSRGSKLALRLRALKGLTIASTAVGTTHPSFLAYILKTVGMKLSDINMVTLTDPLAMIEGMKNGKYDGALFGTGGLEPAINDGSAVRWLSLPKDFKPIGNIPLTVAMTRGDWADSHRDVVRRLNAAFAEAGSWGVKKPKGAKAIIKKTYFKDMDEKVYEVGMNDSIPTWTKTGKITRTEFTRMMEVSKLGNPTRNFDSVTYEKLIDAAARK